MQVVCEHVLAVKNENPKIQLYRPEFLKLQYRHKSSGDLAKGRC